MGEKSVLSTLAWRAKWRKRWQKWKKIVLLTIILVIGVPIVLAMSPWGPGKVYDYIEAHKINPVTGKIDPWAAEWMYKLGNFYDFTLKPEKQEECYITLERWYTGVSLKSWAAEQNDPQQIKPIPMDPETVYWVSMAVYQHAEYLWLKRRRGHAHKLYCYYRDAFIPLKESDPDINQKVEFKIAQYKM
jgi:hypothetical protein